MITKAIVLLVAISVNLLPCKASIIPDDHWEQYKVGNMLKKSLIIEINKIRIRKTLIKVTHQSGMNDLLEFISTLIRPTSLNTMLFIQMVFIRTVFH